MSIRMFLLLFIGYLTINVISSHPSEKKYLGESLRAIERLLNFFESNAKDLNLDGLYGLRIAQGQFHALQKSLLHRKDEASFTDNHHLIQSYIEQIDRIGNQSLIELRRKAADYLHRFLLVASRPFFTEYDRRTINNHWIENGEKSGEFDEEESDQCFGELLGSNEANATSQCYASKACWTLMTSQLKKGYRITHQLLWFLVAKNIGCLDHQSNSVQANEHLRQLEDRFCANIYQDTLLNYQNDDNQDLFLEQILLCSIVGYDEFLQIEWLKRIFTWQDALVGCFGEGSETFESISRMRRHLLVEEEMASGCLSHKSGLAAGVFASYIRGFLQE